MAESRFTYTNPEQGDAKTGGAAPGRIEVPVSCDWAALSSSQQERQQELYRQLREDVREVRELEDGYAFRHSDDRDVLLAMAEFIANERLCCPFFEFGITVERGGGSVWLQMTGEGEAKRVLEAEVGVGS